MELFDAYDSKNIQSVYKEIVYKCTPTNGQLKGRLPKLYELKAICPYCGSAYPLDYYRCTEGFVITEDSSGNGFAKRCKDDKNENLGPLLVKQELVSFEKGLFLEQKC